MNHNHFIHVFFLFWLLKPWFSQAFTFLYNIWTTNCDFFCFLEDYFIFHESWRLYMIILLSAIIFKLKWFCTNSFFSFSCSLKSCLKWFTMLYSFGNWFDRSEFHFFLNLMMTFTYNIFQKWRKFFFGIECNFLHCISFQFTSNIKFNSLLKMKKLFFCVTTLINVLLMTCKVVKLNVRIYQRNALSLTRVT